MTNFTLGEYERRLSDLTGLPVTVEVTGRPPKEMLAGAVEGTEVLHVPAVKHLDELEEFLPRFLRTDEQSYHQRFRLAQLLQTHPDALDGVTLDVPAFAAVQEQQDITDVTGNSSLTDLLRSVRASIGHVVFSTPEHSIRLLTEHLRNRRS